MDQHRRILWNLGILACLLAAAGAASSAHGQEIPHGPPAGAPPENTATPVSYPQVEAAYDGNWIRSTPHFKKGNELVVVPRHTKIDVFELVEDTGRLKGYWYRVRAQHPQHGAIDGWMHSTIIHLTPQQIAQLAALPAATLPEPQPTAVPTAVASTPTTGPTAPPPLAVPLRVRVCYDLHSNKACDPDEGIGGVEVYASDPATGEILGQLKTDQAGLAEFTWGINPADRNTATTTISVPYFGQVRPVKANSAQGAPAIKPVIITQLAPLPALLP